MKATLTFNLPEDYEEYKLAVNGSHYHYVIQQMDERLRCMNKYEEHSEEVHDLVHTLREELTRLRHENLNDLI
jgi:hypothetical protein